MLKGQVDFVARLLDTGITFTPIHFKPPVAGVSSATVEMRGLEELSGTVRISLVANSADGISLARTVIESTFNRLAFFHGLAIEPARVTGSNFSPANPQPGNYLYPGTGYINITGYAPKVIIGISSTTIQSELEQPEPPGEVNFGHIRSARLSVGPVEEFMHLYAILLIFFNDRQKEVDGFTVSIEPSVQQTRNPRSTQGTLETVYTRLRNELAHKREGAVLETTKLEMSKYLAGLRTIVQQAISQHS
ncbi:MAG: hypothetical protein DID91_2727704116 [Candidatus Nitrotoga sp. MKT]|nr:MAG: hypothetical protein DID91_2727704116 [Candidatus Nitrotoga sp. MKT]